MYQGDTTFPAGSNVLIPLWHIHRNPKEYSNPEVFKPERHTTKALKANPFCYIPFSAGPRNCIGQKFAMLEMKCVIAKIVRNFELLPMGANIQSEFSVILTSSNGFQMGLRQRVS